MEKKKRFSRRDFLKTVAVGAAVATTTVTKGKAALAEEAPPIALPKEFAESLAEASIKNDFPMTGAEVFARACLDEGLKALFCCPGNYTIVHAMADAGIPIIGGRHEGQMAKAADGFVRVSGEVAACSGTEGPGFTQMIDSIAAAHRARTPLLVLASNTRILNEDTEAGIQTMYQQPITEGIKKWGKRLITPSRVYEYAAYAFRQLKSGVPGPVHLDFPGEVAGAKFEKASDLVRYYGKAQYRTEAKAYPDPKQIKGAIDLIKQAKRPMIVASNGVFYNKAIEVLEKFATKAQIPVTYTGAMRGIFSDSHPLCASTAVSAYASADLVVLIGQYCMPPSAGNTAWLFGPDAKYIRIDLAAEDIGRNLPIELGIISDEKAALETLVEQIPPMTHDGWIAEIAAARKKYEVENDSYYQVGKSYKDAIHPAVIGKELSDFLYRGKIPKEEVLTAPDGWGSLIYINRWLRAYRPGQEYQPAYQMGHIGATTGMSVGPAVAAKWGIGYQAPYKGSPSVIVASDAGFSYGGFEVETMAKYKLPVIVIVFNNNAWSTFYFVDPARGVKTKRALHAHLFQENLRYDKVGEGLGAHGENVRKPEEFLPALERCYKIAATQSMPSVINCQSKKEFFLPAFPPGFLALLEPGIQSYTH